MSRRRREQGRRLAREDALVGERVSHYEILETLGRGGMGVVYRALDVKLERDVALKFLPHHRVGEGRYRERFLREARAASALDHPNVCTVYELGETAQGDAFIAMAYYHGETLRQRLKRGPLEVDRALDLATQVARGLICAHSCGIVHRDIKSANLMLAEGGVVKILDFGIAKQESDAHLTLEGTAVGTPAYMSPEQARSSELDQRTDLWSLGVVLFECLAGHLPFKALDSKATIRAVLRNPPPDVSKLRPDVPHHLAQVIAKALRKDPASRFQTAEEMLAALCEAGEDPSYDPVTRIEGPVAVQRSVRSIAVLPFSDLSPGRDQEYFCDGLTEELSAALARIKTLRVTSRTSAFQFKARTDDVRRICQSLNVDAALEGSVRKASSRLRITAQLFGADDGYVIWSESYDRELSDVFEIQDEIARIVVEKLTGELETAGAPSAGPSGTPHLDAYHLYLRGRFQTAKRTRAGIQEGLALLEQALAGDSPYAPALVAHADANLLSAVYGFASPKAVMPAARASATAALEVDPELAEAHSMLGCIDAIFDWSWQDAARSFGRARHLGPNLPAIRQRYASYYLMPLGCFDRAASEIHAAIEADPLSLALHCNAGLPAFFSGDLETAAARYREVLAIDKSFALAHYFLGRALDALHRHDEAIAELEAARKLSPDSVEVLAALGHAYGRAGGLEKSRRLLCELESRAEEEYVSPYHLAVAHHGLGDEERCFDCLERAFAERHPSLVWLRYEPLFASLGDQPRFGEPIAQLGLPEEPAG